MPGERERNRRGLPTLLDNQDQAPPDGGRPLWATRCAWALPLIFDETAPSAASRPSATVLPLCRLPEVTCPRCLPDVVLQGAMPEGAWFAYRHESGCLEHA